MTTKRCILFFACILLLTGCSAGSTNRLATESGARRYDIPDRSTAAQRPPEGSIFNVDADNDLYADKRARRVGDIVLVKIVENSSGAKKAETKTERDSSMNLGLTSLFGSEQWYGDKNRYFSPSLNVSHINDFDGKGETKRNSTVTATLSARIIEETVNGNLVIEGYREVRVNNETQHIILSGIIRPQDISPDNSVLSSYIANARIEYSGSGVLADKQQPGWLARVFDVVWPF